MDSAALLSCLATDGVAVADAAAGHLDRPVDSCPEWTVRQLVAHLGSTHSWARAVVGARGERVSRSRRDPAPEDDAALLRWYRAGVDELVTALSVDPETPAWTFSPSAPNNAGWWQRRQALETAVHRWDAQSAAGGAPAAPIGASLAVAGIDELLVDFLPRLLSSPGGAGPKGTFHLHATDTTGEWWLDFDAAGLDTRREHAKADTALRGPASGLYLWLWNRQSPEQAGLEVFGRPETVAAWRALRI
jgi:uncharacterized protein (TIGR03083 family)